MSEFFLVEILKFYRHSAFLCNKTELSILLRRPLARRVDEEAIQNIKMNSEPQPNPRYIPEINRLKNFYPRRTNGYCGN